MQNTYVKTTLFDFNNLFSQKRDNYKINYNEKDISWKDFDLYCQTQVAERVIYFTHTDNKGLIVKESLPIGAEII